MSERYQISTARDKFDLDFIHNYISKESYWAKGRSREKVLRSMENSLCFGMYDGQKQIGFGRVATDYVVFAWLMDVFVDPDYRGQGLGELLIKAIVEHPELQSVNGMGLRTNDAQALYAKFGFGKIPAPDTWMFKKM